MTEERNPNLENCSKCGREFINHWGWHTIIKMSDGREVTLDQYYGDDSKHAN